MAKQTLTIQEPYNDSIVAVHRGVSSFVEKAYFRDRMGEDTSNPYFKNFPINMVALKTNWILKRDGKKLLQNMLKSENLKLFESNTSIVIIEFLFKHTKKHILMWMLPVYILQLFFYFTVILLDKGTLRSVCHWINLAFCVQVTGHLIKTLKHVGVWGLL